MINRAVPCPCNTLVYKIGTIVNNGDLTMFFFGNFIAFCTIRILNYGSSIVRLISFVVSNLRNKRKSVHFIYLTISLIVMRTCCLVNRSANVSGLSSKFDVHFSRGSVYEFLVRSSSFASIFRIIMISRASIHYFRNFRFNVIKVCTRRESVSVFLSRTSICVALARNNANASSVFNRLLLHIVRIPIIRLSTTSFFRAIM